MPRCNSPDPQRPAWTAILQWVLRDLTDMRMTPTSWLALLYTAEIRMRSHGGAYACGAHACPHSEAAQLKLEKYHVRKTGPDLGTISNRFSLKPYPNSTRDMKYAKRCEVREREHVTKHHDRPFPAVRFTSDYSKRRHTLGSKYVPCKKG